MISAPASIRRMLRIGRLLPRLKVRARKKAEARKMFVTPPLVLTQFLDRVSGCRVKPVHVAGCAGLLQVFAGEKSAISKIGSQVAIDLPAEQRVQLPADGGGVACAGGTEDTAGRVVGCIVRTLAPELVIFRAHANAFGVMPLLQK